MAFYGTILDHSVPTDSKSFLNQSIRFSGLLKFVSLPIIFSMKSFGKKDVPKICQDNFFDYYTDIHYLSTIYKDIVQ
jgi:hypothetical protein